MWIKKLCLFVLVAFCSFFAYSMEDSTSMTDDLNQLELNLNLLNSNFLKQQTLISNLQDNLKQNELLLKQREELLTNSQTQLTQAQEQLQTACGSLKKSEQRLGSWKIACYIGIPTALIIGITTGLLITHK